MKSIFPFLLSLLAILFCGSESYGFSDQARAERLYSTLGTATTAADSLHLLYDVYDLSEQKKKSDIGWQILDLAMSSGDNEAVMEMLRQMAVINLRDDEILARLLKMSEMLPDGNEKKSVQLFLKVEQATSKATFASPEESQKFLLEYAREDMIAKDDIYENIVDLYRVVIFIGKSSKGSMYLEYITRLEEMIEQLPEDHHHLRNLFYTSAAIFYSQKGYSDKALECDRKLLEQIESLEKKYKKLGRHYRSYDRYYYNCYRRMLRNYKALEPEEIRELYSKCAMLAERDSEVRDDFYNGGRTCAYRMLAHKDYAGAIPYLKKALSSVTDEVIRRELLSSLVEASDSVGDSETLLVALKEYNGLLVNLLRRKADDAYTELQIRYDVNNLKAEKSRLTMQKRDLELATDEKIISITLTALFVLAVILMLLYRSHFSLKRKMRSIKDENEKLHTQIEEILNGDTPAGSQDLREK